MTDFNEIKQFAARRWIGVDTPGTRMQTYWAEALVRGQPDKDCIIGYEDLMRTYWFQSGLEDANGCPVIWIGSSYEEVRSIPELKRALHQAGVTLIAWELEPHGAPDDADDCGITEEEASQWVDKFFDELEAGDR